MKLPAALLITILTAGLALAQDPMLLAPEFEQQNFLLSDNISEYEVVPFSFCVDDMPEYYQSESSTRSLIDSLKSLSERNRIYAAYRLAELKNAGAVPSLIKAYESEPIREAYTDLPNGLRYYALVSIGIIGGNEAEKYLCTLANNIFFANESLSWAKGDIIFIGAGILDGLSMSKAPCSENAFSQLIAKYEKIGRPNATLQLVYSARNRFRMINSSSPNSIFELLNQFKTIDDSLQNEQLNNSFMLITRQKALRINALEIGIADPKILENYKLSIAVGSHFSSTMDEIINVANNWRNRLGK